MMVFNIVIQSELRNVLPMKHAESALLVHCAHDRHYELRSQQKYRADFDAERFNRCLKRLGARALCTGRHNAQWQAARCMAVQCASP